jgi:calcineurin-like phosphoesterase
VLSKCVQKSIKYPDFLDKFILKEVNIVSPFLTNYNFRTEVKNEFIILCRKNKSEIIRLISIVETKTNQKEFFTVFKKLFKKVDLFLLKFDPQRNWN